MGKPGKIRGNNFFAGDAYHTKDLWKQGVVCIAPVSTDVLTSKDGMLASGKWIRTLLSSQTRSFKDDFWQ